MINKKSLLVLTAAAAVTISSFAPVARAQDDAESGAPKILLDKPAAVVAYQLKRLSNAQLLAVDRKPDDAKYKPVYAAVLTRKGLERKHREEAVEAIAKIDKSDPATVLLDAIAKMDAEDKATPRELAGLLMAQKPDALAARRDKLSELAKESESATVKQASFAALATADGKPDAVWQLATESQSLPALLAGVPSIANAKVRSSFYARVKEAVEKPADDATRAAAVEALGSIPGQEADAFKLLADVAQKADGDVRAAAVRAIGKVPASKWPKDQLEPLAKSIVALVEKTPADQRTSPAIVQAVQLGNDLAGAMGPEKGAPIRKSLRELAVRVVVFRTIKEEMMYDVRYFAVQAGKPVQVILDNDDTMPHNVVFTAPGKMQIVAAAAQPMQLPDDPNVKPFVPEDPAVLHASALVNPGEATTLSFTAPEKPGSYPYLCTYPGHFTKMYGVMVVVADLDAYEKNPTVPRDPMTKQPFDSQRNEPSDAGHKGHQH